MNELRDYLVRRGVSMVSIDEFKTSMTCHKCGAANIYRRSVISDNGSRSYPSYGVLSCKNLYCGITMNRDVNGARNIHHLLYNYLNGLDRPSWLRRPPRKNKSTVGDQRSSSTL